MALDARHFAAVIPCFRVHWDRTPWSWYIWSTLLPISYWNKIFCGMWARNTTHGESLETHLWTIHGLCFEESFLWDGDAHSLWALRHKPCTSCTKGSRCFVGPMMTKPSFVISTLEILSLTSVRILTLAFCCCSSWVLFSLCWWCTIWNMLLREGNYFVMIKSRWKWSLPFY